jgi:hypothetical protein
MAERLLDRGRELTVWNRTAEKLAPLAALEAAEVSLLLLRDGPVTERLLLAGDGHPGLALDRRRRFEGLAAVARIPAESAPAAALPRRNYRRENPEGGSFLSWSDISTSRRRGRVGTSARGGLTPIRLWVGVPSPSVGYPRYDEPGRQTGTCGPGKDRSCPKHPPLHSTRPSSW